jgi:DNA gyrase subunit A
MTETTPPADRIEDLQIEQELQDSYLTYAMSTIMDRALPDVRDGLKPSQRRIIVAMNDLNLRPAGKHLKCAKITGTTSGDYHPHGDQVLYPTLVRMAQDWTLRYTLIHPQGNFGSTDGDPPAAMRYTEARPTAVAMEMLQDLNLDTVDFQPNYDERLMEPTVLPGKFPNLLVNGSTGIAVGMACNLLPHNLREICDAIVRVIDNPETELAELLGIVQGPDFPTGGVICGRDGIVEGYRTGRGRVTLRAKIKVEEIRGGKEQIIIEELPYGIIRKNIMESIANAAKNDQIKDIAAVNDHSGREHKVRIVVDLKRDADPNIIINQLYQFTPCQITVSMINIALVNRQPRTMGLKELIQHFIAHRKEVITRRTRFLLRKAQQRGHILEGLIFAVCDIDEVVRLIRSSKTREEAIGKLRERAFRIAPDHPYAPQIPQALLEASSERPVLLSQAQAEAIGRLQLIQLVGLEIEKLVNEYREVVEEIEGYEAILRDERLILDIIREDTIEMKEKYGDDRRTQITGEVSAFNMEALIAQEDVVVTVSHNGYIKRLPVDTYRAQGRGGRGIRGAENREGDFIEHLFVANTHDHLLFFTNKGRVYDKRVFDVPEMSRTTMGRSIANLLEFQPGEKLASVLAIRDFGQHEQFLLFATARGVIKKTTLSAYGNILSRGIIAIKLDEGDELIGVALTSGQDEVLLGTKLGMAVRFNEDPDKGGVRAMGRNAGGVRGITLASSDEVVCLIVVPAGEEPAAEEPDEETGNGNGGDEGEVADVGQAMVLVATENGYGKRTPVEQYRLTRRGGKGVRSIRMTDRNGPVVGMLVTHGGEDLMLITQRGILIRTRADEISAYGRAAAGVKLIRIDEGDRLVAMARIDAEEAEKADVIAEPTAEDSASEPSEPEAPRDDAAERDPDSPEENG